MSSAPHFDSGAEVLLALWPHNSVDHGGMPMGEGKKDVSSLQCPYSELEATRKGQQLWWDGKSQKTSVGSFQLL